MYTLHHMSAAQLSSVFIPPNSGVRLSSLPYVPMSCTNKFHTVNGLNPGVTCNIVV